MKRLFSAALIAICAAGFAVAQETESEAAKSEEAQRADAEFPVAQEAPGAPEVRATFGDWEQTCFEMADGENCVLIQFGKTGEGQILSRVTIEALPADAEAAAGITVIAPLGILLQAGLGFQIDDGRVNRYPFAVCEQDGCLARFGLTATEIEVLKAGEMLILNIVPAGSNGQALPLNVTLAEFSDAWDAIKPE
ncbi:MAG: invasion associated locus B family protein [Pseudomonadota bacterium]